MIAVCSAFLTSSLSSRVESNLHTTNAWRLLKHLLNPENTKTEQHIRITTLVNEALKETGEEQLMLKCVKRYLGTEGTCKEQRYFGNRNSDLESEFSRF
uniref:Uncharacterized protein n=1 Tax=Ixodes ricinus TaxID=34613 RepID=A0A6B0UED7_IXORI